MGVAGAVRAQLGSGATILGELPGHPRRDQLEASLGGALGVERDSQRLRVGGVVPE